MISSKRLAAFLAALLILTSNFIFLPDKNPDWEAYRNIYNSGGAWLLESGRDIAFLTLITTFKSISPNPSYEYFRVALLIFFAFFAWFFLEGKKAAYPYDRLALVFISLATLGLIRFTVQIREGLSIVFYLISLGYVIKAEKYALNTPCRSPSRYKFNVTLSWGLALLAAGTHTAGLILLLSKVTATMITIFDTKSLSLIKVVIWIVLSNLLIILLLKGQITGDITALALERSGDVTLDASSFTTAAIAYWTVNGLMAWYLYMQISASHTNNKLPKQIKVQAFIVSGPLVVLTIGIILVLKGNGVAPIVTVLFVRLFDMLIAMSTIYVAMYSNARFGLYVVLLISILKAVNDLQLI